MKPMRNHAVDYIKHHDLGGTPCKMHGIVGTDLISRQKVPTD